VVVRIGSNILSQTVQRNLARSTADLSTASERLASGQRINKGADDAAGLAIATSLRTDSRIFGQALRNLNDGISFTNIAESAMESLTTVAERIQEISTQAMSGTFGDAQRQSMQREVTALQAEWNRIVEGTTFNGRNILTGADTRTVLQGGKGVDGTLAVQIGEAQLEGGIEGFAGGTTRISTDSSGNQAMGGVLGVGSSAITISADGRYVAFDSYASNLVTGDTNGQTDVFIKDTVTGAATRVSTDSAGNQATGGASFAGAISADGRYVAFVSYATDLVAGDTNGVRDAFIKDTVTGTTTRVSTDSAGNQATGGYSYGGAISADGRYVAFWSTATNLVAGDTNAQTDSFIKDTLTGVTRRISTDSSGNQATGGRSIVTAISADGRYVAFSSTANNLVAGDTNGQADAFIKDTVTGVTTRVSTDSAGNQATGGYSYGGAISADGRYVTFTSWANDLVVGDTNGQIDVFIKDTVTGVTTRVSTDSAGNQGNGPSEASSISADGRFVAFTSGADNLVTGDTNTRTDVFVKDTLTGVTTRASTDTAGNQGNPGTAFFPGHSRTGVVSADGRFVAFASGASNLVAGDTNSQFDVFLRDLTKTGVQTMSGMVVSNRVSAGVTLNLIQRYRDELLQYRSNIGATTSRISTFMNVVSASNINYKAAESRISDADIASEAANTVRNTILQQTASSLLGQANQAPQIALRLLQSA
jgi:flagellin-like hook-associated protein FlgL